ncbi:hypothetical protein KM043_009884 [Ampulex compressa]|nr:hypothetical protein KM043_009884 [Ampulex compressa]
MAAHQHNYSSPRLPGRSPDEGQVLYSNASRGGAREHGAAGVEGVVVPRGRREEVEGCRLTEERRRRRRNERPNAKRDRRLEWSLARSAPREEITSSGLTQPSPT